jgi:hypothetical protein
MDVLKGQIQQHLKSIPDLNITSSSTVAVTPLVKDDGSLVIPKEHLGLTLVNIEEEKVLREQISQQQDASGLVSNQNPELRLNLYILVAANFKTYSTALKYLSATLGFFQARNVFTAANTPELDSGIEKLIVELHTMGLEQQNHLWGYLGAKYLPSVCYKVRMLTIQEGLMQSQRRGIGDINIRSRDVR